MADMKLTRYACYDSLIGAGICSVPTCSTPEASSWRAPFRRAMASNPCTAAYSFGMYDPGVPGQTFKKSARIVGDVIGGYHLHGDSACATRPSCACAGFSPAIRSWTARVTSVPWTVTAVACYTEARMTRFGEMMLEDPDKETPGFRSEPTNPQGTSGPSERIQPS